VELVGDYITSGSQTLYRCLIHGETHQARSQYVQNGGGLQCCNTHRKKTREEHLAEIAAYGKVELLGDYISSGINTAYRCIEHGEVHEVRPSHTRLGGTLPCCASNRKKTREEHVAAIAALETVELVGSYNGSNAKTLYRCLRHNEKHLSRPSVVLKGHGLNCCSRARVGEAHSNFVNARAGYDQKLAKIGKVIRVGEYKGARKWMAHRCLQHGEVHEGLPTNLLRGHSLVCCREVGDSFERALSGTSRFSQSETSSLYIYELLNHQGYLKPGISNNCDKRADTEYGAFVSAWERYHRTLVYLPEQVLLKATRLMAHCPPALKGWPGETEVRRIEADALVAMAQELMDEIDACTNPWEFAIAHGLLTPTQEKRAQALIRAGVVSEAELIPIAA
jgi:hypothetical protein